MSTDFDDDPNVMAARNAAGTGIGSDCQIPRMGTRDSIGDIGQSRSSPFPSLPFSSLRRFDILFDHEVDGLI